MAHYVKYLTAFIMLTGTMFNYHGTNGLTLTRLAHPQDSG